MAHYFRCGTNNPDEYILTYLFPLSPVSSSGSYLIKRTVCNFIDGSGLGLV